MGISDADARLEHARRAWVRAGEAYLLNPADPALARAEAEARRAYDTALQDWPGRPEALAVRSLSGAA